jgi:hypothetical protein
LVEPAQASWEDKPYKALRFLIEEWPLMAALLSRLALAVAELWNTAIAGFNSFWAFLLLVIFGHLKQLVLGVVVTLGGAFLPGEMGLPAKKAQTATGTVEVSEKKILFRGTPRLAVCVVGVLIVAQALWQDLIKN